MYAISEIARFIGAAITPGDRTSAGNRSDHFIAYLQTDSRNIHFPAQSLFFALRGVMTDGHRFLEEAYAKGVRNFVVEKLPEAGKLPEANLLQVSDALEALQQLAATHRQRVWEGRKDSGAKAGNVPLPAVFAITGSNGKTVVKEWLFQLLEPDFSILRSPRSYNSQTGVPLSVWNLRSHHQIALIEAGISRVGEMEKLARIIAPTHGIFTTLGSAHDAGFADRQSKLQEKLNLFASAQTLYYGCDQEEVHRAILKRFPHKQLRCWSMSNPQADLYLTEAPDKQSHPGYTRLYARYQGQDVELEIPFSDRAAIQNALLCWLILLDLGLDPEVIRRRMAVLEPVSMRLELRPAINGSLLINDAYNNDLHALQIALHYLRQQSRGLKRMLILTDILQSGEDRESLYQKVAQLLAQQKVEEVVAIGSEISRLRQYLPKGQQALFFPDTDSLLKEMPLSRFAGKAILLKGARRFALEKIADRLAQKVHQTYLEINLDALTHNLNFYRRQLREGVKMLVMVKAAAYGSGAIEIARLLEQRGIACLGVAYADEGVALREAGIRLPILVMNPEASAFPLMLRHGLEPEIYAPALLRKYLLATQGARNIPGIHLKLETGMHRLGLSENTLDEVLELLKAHPHLRVQSIFSHLAASENPEKDAYTRQQARRFRQMAERVVDALAYTPALHLLNSAGILRFPEFQFDMVRLGIGFYGISSLPEVSRELQTALSLKARISQIKEVPAGEPVGYGASAFAKYQRRIATISIGYADGLLRLAGNGRFSVSIRAKEAPTAGNICMDMCMVDVTHIPEAEEGDEVTIFGPDKPIEQLADALQTIPYEVLTNISERVKRVYLKG